MTIMAVAVNSNTWKITIIAMRTFTTPSVNLPPIRGATGERGDLGTVKMGGSLLVSGIKLDC